MTQITNPFQPEPDASDAPHRPRRSSSTMIIALAIIVVIAALAGIYWRMAVAGKNPPDLKKASPEEVVQYLGDLRGLAHMPVDQREEYLLSAYKRFSNRREWIQIGSLLRRMPISERETFRDAVFDIAKVRFLEYARQYNKLPVGERHAFVDKVIQEVERKARQLGGQINPAESAARPMRDVLPDNNDALMQFLVTRTTPREREEAQPLVEAFMKQFEELKDINRRKKRHIQEDE